MISNELFLKKNNIIFTKRLKWTCFKAKITVRNMQNSVKFADLPLVSLDIPKQRIVDHF